MTGPTVCFGGEGKGSAQRYFRADLPARALARKGWRTMSAELALPPESPMEIANDPRIRGGNFVKDDQGNVLDIRVTEPAPDIITLRLMDAFDFTAPEVPDTKMPDSIERARKAGQIVLYDLDDDVFNIPEWSPAAHARSPLNPRMRAVDKEILRANLLASDGAMCSTPRIQQVLAEEVPQVRTWIMRNGIDPTLYRWPRKPLEHTPLRVGWMGSVSHHLPHLRTMDAALSVLDDFGAEFVFCGWAPAVDAKVVAMFETLPCSVKKAIPWVDFRQMPAVLAELDLGIIPRVDTPFNEGQSTTSGMQYACAGVPFVAFPSAEYLRLEDMGAGMTARTVDEWRYCLELLLADSRVRAHYREQGQRAVAANHGPTSVAKDYDHLFRNLLHERESVRA